MIEFRCGAPPKFYRRRSRAGFGRRRKRSGHAFLAIRGRRSLPWAAVAPPRLVSVFYVQSPPELFWLTLDHVMPDGPPAFLTFIILLLAILNGITALSRW
jgi:hypothetical protein